MKNFVCIACALLLCARPCPAMDGDSLKILFWNVENFFDYTDSGVNPSDAEFSSRGERRWTRKRFLTKCGVISKLIFWEAEGGEPADVVAFAELENARVLRLLRQETLLRKKGYGIVHYDSPDPRGIDVGLLYRYAAFREVSSAPAAIPDIATRDILVAQFVTAAGDSLALMVNHHPSKYGGDGTEARRSLALDRLRSLSDSLRLRGWTRQLAIGDFNEDARAELFDVLEGSFENLGRGCPDGSIRFDGQWQLIDNAFVSPGAFSRVEFKVLQAPFLLVRDNAHSGYKPFRTYSGPRYNGGVSDHLPVSVNLEF